MRHLPKWYIRHETCSVVFDGRTLAVVYGYATWPSFSYMYFMWAEDDDQ